MPDEVKQAALERAIDDTDSLVLFYQPIHDAKTREVIAAEALLRQRRESGEIREASAISKAAEEAPVADLFTLDSWTTDTAYRAAARWQAHPSARDVRLNVNLSPREFQEGDVIARLRTLVTGCGIDSRLINLEITETSYIKHPDDTMHVLEALKEYGLQLWLDDFGTGHSSVQHLQKFPLDGIKIPAEFVKDLQKNQRSQVISRGLVTMAHDLGFKVIAEGIEHQEQLDFLRDAGCDYIQGFLFSKPMALEDFEQLLGVA
jgi:EAL domain-containing protein (putative c-di-GMP-specific phosphodiesterase class I)